MYYLCSTEINQLTHTIMKTNMKVMEAAYNFTDAVIENKEYTIERGFYPDMLIVKINFSGAATPIAYYNMNIDTLTDVLPISDVHQQELKKECLQYSKELEAAEQREKELEAEFEAWRKSNGK